MSETNIHGQPIVATPRPQRRLFTATLVLGVPGAGKTSLLAGFAEYLWETYRRVLCLYSWDGGAIPTVVQRYMKLGLIRFWRVRTRSADGLGIETLYLASKGYWPRKINPETGESSPAVDLVPPKTTRYTVTCLRTGVILAQLPNRSVVGPTFCESCRTMHPLHELHVAEDVHRTPGFEQVGGVAFDGLTSMTGVVLEFMDQARGQGQIGGEKSSFGGTVVSGSVKLGGNNRADVGFGQSRGQQFVNNSLSIPDLVEGPIFTALSMEASDEGGLAIVGPKLPGRAATDEAGAWFGNVSEVGLLLDDAGKEHHALYTRPFTDKQGRRHLLKTSASPTGVPDVLIDPIEAPWSQASLGVLFRLLDEDLRRALAQEMPGTPGIAGTPADYGDEPAFQTPTPPSVAASPGAAKDATPGVPTGLVAGGLPPLVPAAGLPAGPSLSAPPPTAAVLSSNGPLSSPPTVSGRRRGSRVQTDTGTPATQVAAALADGAAALPPVPPPAAPATAVAPVDSGAPPPPPGMRPPQRVPTGPPDDVPF